MRLFEAIVDANHRAVAGDANAGLHPGDFAEELPVIALTCIDPRLNAYFPNALALPVEQFIWLRNAGNNITSPLSSTMRSLALACAVKGGKEIAVIGHTDCHIARTTTMQLLDRLKALGVDRHQLPENLNEYFGMFSSERQNIIKACDLIRRSPLIGPKIPVHGLLLDIENGKLEWIVNGYQTLETATHATPAAHIIGQAMEKLVGFNTDELKFPEAKIGELAARTEDWAKQKAGKIEEAAPITATEQAVAKEVGAIAEKYRPKAPPVPPKIPPPPPLRVNVDWRRPAQ